MMEAVVEHQKQNQKRKRFRKTLAMGCVLALLGGGFAWTAEPAQAAPVALYASPGGSGTVCSSSLPCSLTDAQTKAKTLNANMTGSLTVYLFGGTYRLNDTFTLGASDSGSNGYSVTYRNYPGQTPVLSGGVPVTGWTVHDAARNIYQADVGTQQFRQLYISGSRAVRARTPNVTDTATGAPYLTAKLSNPFKVVTADVGAWTNLNRVEVVKIDHWHQKRMRIDNIQVSGDTASIGFLSPEAGDSDLNHENQSVPYYYFENAYEMLDAEGEWYLDTTDAAHHILYYKPRAGENMASVQAIAPKLETLVRIEGTAGAPAHHIGLRGITLAHTNWTRPDVKGFLTNQAALELHTDFGSVIPGALWINNANNVRIEENTVRQTGAHGILLTGNLHHNAVVGNTVTDTSAGGIYEFSEESSYDLVSNNLVEKVGQFYTEAVGILATRPDHMTIEFNEVRSMPYTGISIGWKWGDEDTGTDYNTVQYNHIHDVMQLHDDGAGIYTLGKMVGSTFENNYIHDFVLSPYSGGNPLAGIYLDNGSAFKLIQNNVLDNTSKAFYSFNVPNHDNQFKRNYYNHVSMGKIRNDAANTNLVTANVGVTGSAWPAAALDIMGAAGLMTNRAVGKTATASSSYDATYTPDKAVNDSTDDPGWSSQTTAGVYHVWKLDLGEAYRINKVEVVPRMALDQPSTRTDFEVWVSNNPNIESDHIVVGSVEGGSFPHQTTWSTIVEAAAEYRYIALAKVVATYFYVSEVRVYTAAQELPQHASAAPGKPVLASDNGYDTGLMDGSYTVKMNMYNGNNGTAYKLFENGALIDYRTLADATPGAQTVATTVYGKPNGTYTYTCQLVNSLGPTACDPLIVQVTDANPGTPVLSADNSDGDGSYDVTMNMWWGTNASVYRLYENDVLVDTQPLAAHTPNAQSAVTPIAGKAAGTYMYRAELANSSGTTASTTYSVVVN